MVGENAHSKNKKPAHRSALPLGFWQIGVFSFIEPVFLVSKIRMVQSLIELLNVAGF